MKSDSPVPTVIKEPSPRGADSASGGEHSDRALQSSGAPAPAVTVHIPTQLRNCCKGASELVLAGASVRAVLEELERNYPRLHGGICDETGKVRRHINVFVNSDHMRECDGLDTTLALGDEVTILPAVSGG